MEAENFRNEYRLIAGPLIGLDLDLSKKRIVIIMA